MKKIGRILSPDAMKENIQKLFLETINTYEPIVLENFPMDVCLPLLRSEKSNVQNSWAYPRIPYLIETNNASLDDLFITFPNANKKTIERDFVQFRQKMVEWTDQFYLNKGWIYLSICWGVMNHLNSQKQWQDSKIAFSDVVKMRYVAGPDYGVEFISGFNINDYWHSASENFDEYETRIKHKLVKQRAEIKSMLSRYTQITKPRETHQLLWLIHWNVRGWSAAQIAKEDCNLNPERSPMEKNAFDSKKKYIYDEIQKLKLYDLPIRKRKNTLNLS